MTIISDLLQDSIGFTTTASNTTSPASFLGASPVMMLSDTAPLSLKEAQTLRKNIHYTYNLFKKSLEEHSTLTPAWDLSYDIYESPALKKAYQHHKEYEDQQTLEALLDPILLTTKNCNRSLLALNIDEPGKDNALETKVELFCLREDCLPKQNAMNHLCQLLDYPYSQYEDLLPSKTRSIGLEILSGKKKTDFFENDKGTTLGDGFFGEVYKSAIQGEPCAVKTLKKHKQSLFNEEYQTVLCLDHPNIVKVIHADNKHLYMEYIEGTPLIVEDFPAIAVIDILIQMTDALIYLHDLGYTHSDLHEGNLLVTADGKVKLIDFGGMDRTGDIDSEVLSMINLIQFWAKEPTQDLKKLKDYLKLPTSDKDFTARGIKASLIKARKSLSKP